VAAPRGAIAPLKREQIEVKIRVFDRLGAGRAGA
jgi:hypothetical protein